MIRNRSYLIVLASVGLFVFAGSGKAPGQADGDSSVANEELLIEDILGSGETEEEASSESSDSIDSLLGDIGGDTSEEDSDSADQDTENDTDIDSLLGDLSGGDNEAEAEDAVSPSTEAPREAPVGEGKDGEIAGLPGKSMDEEKPAESDDDVDDLLGSLLGDTDAESPEESDVSEPEVTEVAETGVAEEDADDGETAEEELSDLLGGFGEQPDEKPEEEATEPVEVVEEPEAEETAEDDLGLDSLLGDVMGEPEEEETEVASQPEEEDEVEEMAVPVVSEKASPEDELMKKAQKMEDSAAAMEEQFLKNERLETSDESSSMEKVAETGKDVQAVETASQPEPEKRLSPELENVMTEEELRRIALEQHAKESIRAGQKALSQRQFDDAIKMFETALDERIPKRSETQWVRDAAKAGLAETYYQQALFLEIREDYENARKKAEQAANRGHKKAAELFTKLTRLIEKPPMKETPPPPDYIKSKELHDKERSITHSLRQGRRYLAAGEYGKAEYEFESILKDYPDNTEAMRLLNKVARERKDRADMELETTRDSMIADLRETWNPRDYALARPGGIERNGGIQQPRDPIDVSARTRLIEKMKRIEIPAVNFRQANINDVVDFLQEASVEYDPTEDDARRGVNIILNIEQAGQGQDAAAATGGGAAVDDIFGGGFGAEDVQPVDDVAAAGGGGGVPLITFSARYISLFKALQLVTQVAELKLRIEEDIVMIVPKNAAIGDIVVRMYNVLPTVEQRIPQLRQELQGGMGSTGGGSSGGFSPFGGGSAAGGGAGGGNGMDWKMFFQEMGVNWPDGSSIKYMGSIGKMIVANTADNLAVFEQVLSIINVVPHQIEIEARFVEIRRGDMNSLGFEWLLTDDWEIAADPTTGSSLSPSSQERLVVKENSSGYGRGGFTRANRFVSETISGETVSDSLVSIAGVLTNPELEFILHAMEQKGYADMLSAPKVTTQAGTEATIKVVTEYIYPTDFDVTPILAGTEDLQMVVGGMVEPNAFETREVGVILAVMADVSQDGQMITLTMTPEVVTEPTWWNYGSRFTDSNGNEVMLNMEQPFFHTRTVATSLSIYNGATVVMGGMITENRESVDDKIPFLGDIPIIGRLFRSKHDSSDKRNLLIFVTAKLVDPAGKAVAPDEQVQFLEERMRERQAED